MGAEITPKSNNSFITIDSRGRHIVGFKSLGFGRKFYWWGLPPRQWERVLHVKVSRDEFIELVTLGGVQLPLDKRNTRLI